MSKRAFMCMLIAMVILVPSYAYECPLGTTALQLVQERKYDMTGQVAVITGGDSGIGMGVMQGLAAAGARVILLAHNMESTAKVIKDTVASTGNKNLEAVPINLFSLASVKTAATEVLKRTERIDVFVGDAGEMPSFVTEDGLESTFQSTYISQAYLVELFLPKLRKAKGRVVYTGTGGIDPYDSTPGGMCASAAEDMGCEALDVLDKNVHLKNDRVAANGIGGNTFIALYLRVLHAREISMTETDVTAYSFNPGLVGTPSVKGVQEAAIKKLGVMLGAVLGLILGTLLGLVIGCAKGKCCRCCCGGLLFGLIVGGLLGFCTPIIQQTAFADVIKATGHPFFEVMCNGNGGVPCPETIGEGAASGLYLSAAPMAELRGLNGEFTTACGYHPDKVKYEFDPYDLMVAKIGKDATDKYLMKLYDMTSAWISTAKGTETLSAYTSIDHFTSINTLVPFFMVIIMIGLGGFTGFRALRRDAGEQAAYILLEGDVESRSKC